MKDIDSFFLFCDIKHTPFAKNMYSNFLYSGADRFHLLPVSCFETMLNGAKFKSGDTANLFRKIPEIFETRSDKF